MKNKILEFLFKRYAKGLQVSADIRHELYESSLDVVDLVRGRLKGLRVGYPDTDVLQDKLSSLGTPERLDFLSKAQDIVQNDTFKFIVDYLIMESEHKAMLNAVDMAQVNFNRATINGLMLLEEELTRLASMYKDEKELNKGMTEAERHSAL